MSLSPDVESWFSLNGRKALITGGSRGIGYMIARGFLAAGAEVAICARSRDEVDEAVQTLGEVGSCIGLQVDISNAEGRDRVAAWSASSFEKLDILVNNAGTGWGEVIDSFPEIGFEKVLRVNVTSMFDLTRRLLPSIEMAATAERRGRVINIGSVDGLRVPSFDNFSYSASKAGVHMLTRHLAKVLIGRNINVNCIAPGFFPSKMTAHLFDADHPFHTDPPPIPMGRTGTPADIAAAAIYLAAPASEYVTGVVLPVAGGLATTD